MGTKGASCQWPCSTDQTFPGGAGPGAVDVRFGFLGIRGAGELLVAPAGGFVSKNKNQSRNRKPKGSDGCRTIT